MKKMILFVVRFEFGGHGTSVFIVEESKIAAENRFRELYTSEFVEFKSVEPISEVDGYNITIDKQ